MIHDTNYNLWKIHMLCDFEAMGPNVECLPFSLF